MSLRFRRGTEAQRTSAGFIPDQGEPVWVQSALNTDNHPAYKLYIGDGVTPGGIDILQSSAGSGLHYNATTGKIDLAINVTSDAITEGSTNLFYHSTNAINDAYTALNNGSHPGVTYTYDSVHHVINTAVAGVSGFYPVQNDTSPLLGGNLGLNGHNITGAGNLNFTGNINTDTGTITTSGVTISGSVSAGGNIAATGSVSAATGTFNSLGGNLALGSYNINGSGGINITGSITASSLTSASINGSLGSNLTLNGHNILGTGNVQITGNLQATGTLTFGSLGGDLTVNNHNINGATNITASGTISSYIYTSNDPINRNGLIFQSNNPLPFDIQMITDGTSNGTPSIRLLSSQGDIGSPSNNAAGDHLSNITFLGYYGSNYFSAGGIFAKIDPTAIMTNGAPATNLSFGVANNSGSFNIMTFNYAGVLTTPTLMAGDGSAVHPSIGFTTDNSQDTGFFHPADGVIGFTVNGVEAGRWTPTGLQIAGATKTGSFNGSGSYPTPSAGMIIFDSSNNHFYGYNGSTWKQLDN